MQTPGVTVYNLQKKTGEDQIKNLPDNANFVEFEGDFDDSHGRFMDTAAVMKNLDLVISVDTSICHLAAGLGVPTWVPMPNPPDWRWMLDRPDTPWYPNMRLFRQPTPGDWDSVMQTIYDELMIRLRQPSSFSEASKSGQTSVSAEVSTGEFIDKMTILRIKKERIKNKSKLKNVHNELEALEIMYEACIRPSETLESLTDELLEVNKQLWDIEDAVREKEAKQEFDEDFVEIARSVYLTNDERCRLKKAINLLLGSRLVEEKSYGYL